MLKTLWINSKLCRCKITKRKPTQIARQEIEGFTHLIRTYINSVKDTDLPEEETLDTLTLLYWYIYGFWESLARQTFSATKLIAEKYPQLMDKLPEMLQYIYDSNCFPKNFITIRGVLNEILQKLKLVHHIFN